jgi:hypothetical protein
VDGLRRACALLASCVVFGLAHAQLGGPPHPDPATVLAQAKAASGGAAWDALRTQHSKVHILTGGIVGEAERWSEYATGRSLLNFTIGPVTGSAGFDGKVAWSQDAAGEAHAEIDVARELAVNAAYRDQLAFWYPERAPARIAYKERTEADGAFFDVIRITPEGGRPFELWINTETKLIERLVEREAQATRTEIYMDLRTVDGVQIPFRVRASRGAGRHDEVVTVDLMEFNVPLGNVRFAQPPPPKPDFAFPGGHPTVEVPFDFVGGHVFLTVTIDGKPARMLLDSSGRNVLLPGIAAPAAGAAVGVARAGRVDIGGLGLERQVFAVIDLHDHMRRVEGMEDVAGVLGYEVLRRMPVKLDYERSRATFYDPAKFRYAGHGVKTPLTFRAQAPQVRATIDGVAATLTVDTGSRGSLTLARAFVYDNDLAQKYAVTSEAVVGATIGGPIRARLARVKALEVGEVAVPGLVAALTLDDTVGDGDAAGKLGNGFLRRFSVTFDFPGNAMYLEKNGEFARRDAYDRAGMWIERGIAGFEVVDVASRSPAEAAGMKIGDVIVAVDERRANAVSLAALRALLRGEPGRKVRLTIEGGAVRVVTLRDLV